MQEDVFAEEMRLLKRGECVSTTSMLRALDPFLDEDNLIRVGGRLANAEIRQSKKHPCILPSNHHLTRLMVQDAHVRHLHAVIKATLAAVRLQYWPINGRSTIRKYVRPCITCFKNKPNYNIPQMGQLPSPRVTPAPPLRHVGVDYAGPILLKPGNKRSKITIKGYIAVFVCFATKAMHLEAVSDLTSAAFIAAYRRFAGRRGVPAHVYSDHGTNFVGAKRELQELIDLLHSSEFENTTENEMARKGTQWHLIPPHSPHFGGLWEAGVKSVKFHLRRIAGNSHLTFEELNTWLIQIEAVLNSRPLCPMSEDPNDLTPLTAAHFLIGRSLTDVPDPSCEDVPINLYQGGKMYNN